MERSLKFSWNCWSLNEMGSLVSQLIKTCELPGMSAPAEYPSTWNMTWGENTKSSRTKIDTVRCVGPSHKHCMTALQKRSFLLSIIAAESLFFFFFFLSFFNILWEVRRGQSVKLAKMRRDRPTKVKKIYTVHRRTSPKHNYRVSYTTALFVGRCPLKSNMRT